MTLQEMSNEFDVLYNNIMSNQAPGIDEYEKSLFLTKAQSELIKAYFDQRGNKYQEGFDNGEKRQYDFSSIVRHTNLVPVANGGKFHPFDPRSYMYQMPASVFLILNEQIREYDEDTNSTVELLYRVLPIDYNQYAMQMSKPFKFPPKNVVWRLITTEYQGDDSLDYSVCEIIGRFRNPYPYNAAGTQVTHPTYYMRYVVKPTPIILTDLTDAFGGISIEGHTGHYSASILDPDRDPIAEVGGGVQCILPSETHAEIVQRAVELAKATYDPQMVQVTTGIGNLSSTNLGVIPQSNNRE